MTKKQSNPAPPPGKRPSPPPMPPRKIYGYGFQPIGSKPVSPPKKLYNGNGYQPTTPPPPSKRITCEDVAFNWPSYWIGFCVSSVFWALCAFGVIK